MLFAPWKKRQKKAGERVYKKHIGKSVRIRKKRIFAPKAAEFTKNIYKTPESACSWHFFA